MGCTDSTPVSTDNDQVKHNLNSDTAATASSGGQQNPLQSAGVAAAEAATKEADASAAAIAPPKTAPSTTTTAVIDSGTPSPSPGNSPNPLTLPKRAADVASEEGVERVGNTLSIPTAAAGRRRSSSVRLVMGPDDVLTSPRARSPPSKSFEVAAQQMEALELTNSTNTLPSQNSSGILTSAADGRKNSLTAAAGGSSPGPVNPLAAGRVASQMDGDEEGGVSAAAAASSAIDAPAVEQIQVAAASAAADRRDSLSSGADDPPAGTADLDLEDADVVPPSALQSRVAAASGDVQLHVSGIDVTDSSCASLDSSARQVHGDSSAAVVASTSGSFSNSTSPARAGDVAGEEGVLPRGNSLVIPTHSGTTRRRASSVSLVMTPEEHLVSPRRKSPPRGFEERQHEVEMPALQLADASNE